MMLQFTSPLPGLYLGTFGGNSLPNWSMVSSCSWLQYACYMKYSIKHNIETLDMVGFNPLVMISLSTLLSADACLNV